MSRLLFIIGAIVGLVGAGLVGGSIQRSCAPPPASPQVERETLRDAGLLVAEPVPDLKPELADLERENAELRVELERARVVAPKARVTALLRGRTASAPVAATARPGSTQDSAPGCAAPLACALAVGDELSLEVDAVQLETRAGSTVVAGTAAARRTADAALLLRAPWSAELSSVTQEARPAPREPGWGVGPWGVMSSHGWAAGAAVAPPRFRIFGLQVEPSISAGAGPIGPVVGAQVIGR